MSVWVRKGSGFVMSVDDADDAFYASDADWEKQGAAGEKKDTRQPSSEPIPVDDPDSMKVADLREALVSRGFSEDEAKGMTRREIIEYLEAEADKE